MTGRDRSVGVDLASRAPGTGLVVVTWNARRGRVVQAGVGADDDAIVAAATGATDVGIDSPFGWPVAFAEGLARWQRHEPWDGDGAPEAVSRLTHRATDRFVHGVTGRLPLSVSADRLAYVGFRCARLLAALGEARGLDHLPDRAGTDGIHEVWPYGSLVQWGAWTARYNKPGTEGEALRHALLERLRAEVPLDVGDEHAATLTRHPDAFDALVTALASRAAHRGLALPPPPALAEAAAVEGWILLPEPGSLTRLVGR